MKRSLQLNPDNRPATWEQIKQWRNTHEVSPVKTSYGWFDANSLSDERIMRAIRNWEYLTTLDQNGKLLWKLADNSFLSLTKEELSQVYSEVDIKRTQRSALLHVKAEVFKQQEVLPSVVALKSIEYWLN